MITIWRGISKRVLCLMLILTLTGCSAQSEILPAETVSEEEVSLLAEAISARYGLMVLTGKEAADHQPWDYHFLPEEDEGILYRELQLLDKHLQNYPEGMLKLLSQDCGGLCISLVKEILGNDDTNALRSARGLQFRDAEGHSVLVLAKDREYTLYHELCHVIEDFVVLRTPVWDRWDALNPPDFSYDLDFGKNLRREENHWLQDESRAFIDTYSMSFPREDRARIMEYAMTEGNQSYFSGPVMQAKLSVLSQGIREAFGLTDDPETFLWEQYLKR